MHIHEYHGSELRDKLEKTIQGFLDTGREITYSDISDEIGINRSLISNDDSYSELFKKYIDLKFDYLELTKLDDEKRKSKQIEVIQTAIDRLQSRGEEITQISVANEMGVNRIIFYNNPEYRKLIDQHRSGKGGYNIDRLKSEVEECIQYLRNINRKISFSSIAEELGVYVGTISEKEEIRELIEPHRTGYLPGQKVKKSEVVDVIENLKKSDSNLSKRKILQQLNCDWPKIEQQPNVANFIEDEVEVHNQFLELKFQEERFQQLSGSLDHDKIAEFRYEVVRYLLNIERTDNIVRQVAKSIGTSSKTVYRWMAKYREHQTIESLKPKYHERGRKGVYSSTIMEQWLDEYRKYTGKTMMAFYRTEFKKLQSKGYTKKEIPSYETLRRYLIRNELYEPDNS